MYISGIHQLDMDMVTRDKEYYEDISTAIFKVEDKLFKVRKEQLVRHSTVFQDMFEVPQGQNLTAVEGTDDEHLIHLSGVTASGFRALMRVLYPCLTNQPHFYANVIRNKKHVFQFWLSLNEWFEVYHLATMWIMSSIIDLAISEVNAGVSIEAPLQKILYGRKYNREDWLLSGYEAMVKKTEITPAEIQKIGQSTAIELLSYTVKSLRASGTSCGRGLSASLQENSNINTELKAIRAAKSRGESFPANDKSESDWESEDEFMYERIQNFGAKKRKTTS